MTGEIKKFDRIYTRYSILDTGQIMDNLVPISRVEGGIFYREYSIKFIYFFHPVSIKQSSLSYYPV
jgi:hypothetical protein